MTRRLRRLLLVPTVIALALSSVTLGIATTTAGSAAAAAATLTTRTPVMGPNLLSAAQLARWFTSVRGNTKPNVPSLNNDINALAQTFIDEGHVEGVRGDIAFVQSILETGWFSFAGSQVPPDANNFAGMNAYDGRPGLPNCKKGDASPSRCFPTAAIGVQTQMQLLRSYADATTKTLPHRLTSAPSDRVGDAPIWEYFGGSDCPCHKLIWASAQHYGIRIIEMYSQALVFNGVNAACVPYAPGNNAHNSGTGYWMATDQSHVYTFGSNHFYGDTSTSHLNQPLIGGEATSSADGYWLLGTDGGIFTFGDAKFYGSTGAMHLNQPVLGMERTASGKGYWLFARDGGVFTFGDAKFYGSAGNMHLSSPVVAMQRTLDGRGYWMLTRSGQVLSFGDAGKFGDISGCSNYGGADRLLASPTSDGYWIATADGSVIAFGDARRLGFPIRIIGRPIALMH